MNGSHMTRRLAWQNLNLPVRGEGEGRSVRGGGGGQSDCLYTNHVQQRVGIFTSASIVFINHDLIGPG